MARLDKKSDDRLSQYFKEYIAMCKRVCGRATDEEIILGNLPLISQGHSQLVFWSLMYWQIKFTEACFPLGEFVRANSKFSNVIGWQKSELFH